jgi:AraC-like DNA-binding protein
MPESLMVRLEKIVSMKKDSEGMEVILRSVLLDIIAYAIETEQYERFSQIIDNEKRNISAIDNALHYIRENYSENLSLGIILQLTNYSKSHFIRLFKECTGMNVSEYINKYRIEKACLDLIYTNNNITEIATASGFNNIQYFSRKFKEYMKCTPKQYQKKKKKLLAPE